MVTVVLSWVVLAEWECRLVSNASGFALGDVGTASTNGLHVDVASTSERAVCSL